MTPKDKMIVYCSKPAKTQDERGEEIQETLCQFLKEAAREDLAILNCDKNDPFFYPGLHLTAEILMILGAYAKNFFELEV